MLVTVMSSSVMPSFFRSTLNQNSETEPSLKATVLPLRSFSEDTSVWVMTPSPPMAVVDRQGTYLKQRSDERYFNHLVDRGGRAVEVRPPATAAM